MSVAALSQLQNVCPVLTHHLKCTHNTQADNRTGLNVAFFDLHTDTQSTIITLTVISPGFTLHFSAVVN